MITKTFNFSGVITLELEEEGFESEDAALNELIENAEDITITIENPDGSSTEGAIELSSVVIH